MRIFCKTLIPVLLGIFALACSNTETKTSHNRIEEEADFILINSIETVKQRFNSISSEVESSLRITQIRIREGEPDNLGKIIEYEFSNHLSLVGRLNRNDNSIATLSIGLREAESPTEIADFILATLFLIATTNPELKPDERGNIMKEIGFTDPTHNDSKETWAGKTVKNGNQFSIVSMYGQGIIFNIGRPSD